ncbi:hypothetical protein M758_2G085600 [Ceratodon purpureus]|nr:hypothetical protein M758_2G085600 [Ceratodon purpureus]
MLSVLGMASHEEAMPSVLDSKDAIIVEEALGDELQGDDGIRHYKKGMWTVSELLVLQAVRREDFERQAKGGSREKHSSEMEREHNRSAHERWKWMEDRCWMQGVQRSAGQCQDKWEGITAGFKKVNDYEKNLAIGQPSYWQLGSDDKKKLRLPPNFHKEVFAALQEWYVKSRTGEPGVPFDALNPLRGSASNMEFSGSVGEESDENDVGPISTGKRRRPKLGSMDGIAAVLERNNRSIVDVLRLAEDRKDNRHKQTLQFEREKHRDLIELQKQLGGGYIAALNRIGDALDKFAMVMQGSIRH